MKLGDWSPQPSLAWATCAELLDGEWCDEPAAGWQVIQSTGASVIGVPKCVKHGAPREGPQ